MQVAKTTIAWDALKAYMAEKPRKEYKCISPSSLGGCPRAHYWKLLGVEESTPPNVGALVNFEVGRHWEAVMAKAFESQGKLVKWFQDGVDEPWYDPETHLGGTPDMIINDGSLAILDSKTVNSAYFRYAKQVKKFDDWVKDNYGYIYQQVSYVYLAQQNGYDINRAILSFASKDDGFIGLEFEVFVTPDMIEKVKHRAATLKSFVDRRELPPCECSGWKVGYCGFGNPKTQAPNSKKKLVNTECCDERFVEGEQQ